MTSKSDNKLTEYLLATPEADQDPIHFFKWAAYTSRRAGHASAVWKVTASSLADEKGIALHAKWTDSKDRRRQYWEDLRKKEEADKKMEDWCEKLGEINDVEKGAVAGFQHNRFMNFMDDKSSPFVDSTEPRRKRARDFSSERSESSWTSINSGDVVNTLQEMLPGQKMGQVLRIKKEHPFSCVVEGIDVGELFTQYFERCCLESYKHSYPEDALALSAVLLIKNDSRSPRLLNAFKGQLLTTLVQKFKSVVPSSDASLQIKQQALVLKWSGWVNVVPGDRTENKPKRMEILGLLQNDWKEAVDLDLAEIHTFFVSSIQGLFTKQPQDFQEADGIASFVRNLLAAFLQEVDLVRFSCADKGSDASRYNKTINKLQGHPKQPDMVGAFSHQDVKFETYFGEATSIMAQNAAKYDGDTLRLGVFGKNSHDMIENIADQRVPILLYNIDGMTLRAFVLDRMQDVYPMVEIGTGRIPSSVNELAFLSQDLPFWLQLRRIVRKTSKAVEDAVDAGMIDHQRRKEFFPTITTPSAKGALCAVSKA